MLLTASDAAIEATVTLSSAGVVVSNGPAGRRPHLVIAADAFDLIELAGAPLRFGFPDALAPAGTLGDPSDRHPARASIRHVPAPDPTLAVHPAAIGGPVSARRTGPAAGATAPAAPVDPGGRAGGRAGRGDVRRLPHRPTRSARSGAGPSLSARRSGSPRSPAGSSPAGRPIPTGSASRAAAPASTSPPSRSTGPTSTCSAGTSTTSWSPTPSSSGSPRRSNPSGSPPGSPGPGSRTSACSATCRRRSRAR